MTSETSHPAFDVAFRQVVFHAEERFKDGSSDALCIRPLQVANALSLDPEIVAEVVQELAGRGILRLQSRGKPMQRIYTIEGEIFLAADDERRKLAEESKPVDYLQRYTVWIRSKRWAVIGYLCLQGATFLLALVGGIYAIVKTWPWQ